VLSLAGGLRPDSGNNVTITRKLAWGQIPLPNAKDDPSGLYSVASVGIKSILDGSKPENNIAIKPEDIISVPKADVIYVIGSVRKSGGFALGENTTLSALQVLSLAEGLDNTAAPERAKILRSSKAESTPTQIPLNLRKMLAGKSNDVRLQANDVLFVPSSLTKTAAVRAVETMIGMGGQIGAGLAIYK
jgi:polysaccharide export outer membrane protein